MKLIISKKYDKSFNENTSCLGTYMLSVTATHLYIASHSWESIELELDDSIPDNILGNMRLVCNPENIKVILPEDITDKTVRLLIDLYPDKAGVIRRTYMSGGSIREAVRECLV